MTTPLDEARDGLAEQSREIERQQARVDAALQAGWSIRRDPVRGEYLAARELHTARTLDGLLDDIGAE